ncbi:MAG TPA: phosphatidylinositol kinase, partial [Acidimicrobiaceae bacterium]|nr:phosphatidylinositol kinase [Acidimicrobiaceae bacterium]
AALQRLAAFDLVANSADRKGGHVLLGDDGGVWAVDNALCFH